MAKNVVQKRLRKLAKQGKKPTVTLFLKSGREVIGTLHAAGKHHVTLKMNAALATFKASAVEGSQTAVGST